MIFPFFKKKKPTLSYNENDLFRITVIKDDKFAFAYGILDKHDSETFRVYVPKLWEVRENPEISLDENSKVRITVLERSPKTGELILFSFPTTAVNIDDVSKIVTFSKPRNPDEVEYKKLGTPQEVINREFEASLKVKYRAETSPHEQKSVTYKIRFDGVSMLTNVPIPPPMVLIVTIEIPFEEYDDKFKAEVIQSNPRPLEKKYETVLKYIDIKDKLKEEIFEFGLLHADIEEA